MNKITTNIRILLRGFSFLYKIDKMYTILHIASSALSPLQPYINIYMIAILLNELVGNKDTKILIAYVVVTVLINFIFSIILSALNHLKDYHLEQFYKNEQMLFAKKTMTIDYENIENPVVHGLLERIKNESQNGYNMFFLNMFSGQLIGNISSMITSTVLCYELISDRKIDFYIKVIILSAVLFVIIVNYYATKKSNKENLEMFESLIPYNVMFNFYNDYYENYNAGKDIRLYKLEEYVTDIQKTQNRLLVDILWKTKKKTLKYLFLSSISSDLLNIVIYAFVVYACFAGSILVGNITKYVSSIAMFVSATGNFITQLQSLFNNNKYLKNYFKYFDIPSKYSDGHIEKSIHFDNSPNIIEFVDVSFKYPNTNVYVLCNLSFKIKAGERISVVGMNGSGKTTMVKLLCRLYTPTKGKILLNGVDINEYKYEYYIKLLSVVFQDFKIFSFPIGQNIASHENFNEADVISSAKKAGLEDLLAKMPYGLNTPLYKDFDESGIEISGGEAQKVAIARAIYKDAPIMILDEPTAALDPIAENEIYLKFNEVTKNKTVIFISHRLASCTFSDRILVFHKGEIIQKGNHNDLLKDKNGKYYELWNAQAQYYQ